MPNSSIGLGNALALLGVRPQDCVVVEDAPIGVQAARAARMSVVALTTTHPARMLAEADASVGSLRNLNSVLAALQAAGGDARGGMM
ncbi:HAD-IA family hydrolase [Rubrobacter tropicus]|uniref:HAD-IA family hydrolase n=1 Tax=Rubrobacter tropicus TaxID=2653851 RepID=A0A6G8QD52_9ACTN|nr:HAD-IA family hydrolase [Rubrobacter tropicus]QIN84425.1 HAD-IA family hydrolase [Rubrobacter tropicus]